MKKSLSWIILAILMLSCTVYAASAFEYFTYRMNFPPGTSRYHVQEITFTGNLTITLPGGFSFSSSTPAYNSQSGSNYTWSNAAANTTVNYTIQSPNNCTEGTIYRSDIYNNDTFIDEFRYVCVYDDTVVDYKVEYGHGCGNYLAQDEPYISNEPTTLFNLLRVWNIGHYLDPDEDAQNASIVCNYEDYPVRTYGRVEVGYGDSYVNGSFLWDLIYGGYWFRIGVISQDVSGKSIGDFYEVNCTELIYDFTHHRVVSPFSNYSLEVRTTTPLTMSSTTYGTKALITITNDEKYPLYDVILDFKIDEYTETNHIAVLNPGDTVTYYSDPGENVSASFIPSWQRHCFSPVYYQQLLTNTSAASNASSNTCPTTTSLPSQAWIQNTSKNNAFDLDDYFSDVDNNTLTFNYTGNENITVTINPTTHNVSFNQPEDFTGLEYVIFTANDGNCTTSSNNVTLVVYPSNGTGTSTTTTIIQRSGGRKKVYVYYPVNITDQKKEPKCKEIWVCEEWSACNPESFKNRNCYDANECRTTFYKPLTAQGCLTPEEPPIIEEPIVIPPFEEVPTCKACMILPFMLIFILMLLIILSIPKRKEKDEIRYKTINKKHSRWK